MNPLLISRYTATSCLGRGIGPMRDALAAGRSGLKPCDLDGVALETWIGEVAGADDEALPSHLRSFDCRNNRLAQIGFEQDGFADAVRGAMARHGADRIGVFLGTSTAGILETELAYQRRDPLTGALPADFNYAGSHNPFSVAAFVQAAFGLAGPANVVSSACSSSAKVFASARRMIEAGLIDAAIVGGVDSLCLTTLYGFASLELTSRQACRPFDLERDGISIGEAAAFALLERVSGPLADDAILLLGVGESSDAYHMSSPHPEGLGARRAMAAALTCAGLEPGDIDYINLHGTATPSNDSAESKAVRALFGASTPCSSTKGATGHTLGAAGGVEAVIAALALRDGFLPGSPNTRDPEPDMNYLLASRPAPVRCVLSNSFGFGGTNCSLVLGRAR
ncbi:beta-ketoacyl-[acyl-carrier-protein] synthase family protein [Aromatoleum bremense]|uniref:Beta-ketoacyl-ACP synthase n=1 Tax=Aromatoleum bremense TaxID=76115 RepID=A0ABX1NXF1_9RHOO|nr:beta-ketoacyl-[acyl-carrier-protein] synthase family protein [Aromatoleum bremense]NMG16220.1 beta-ketoacyl-ACP synthase [Aromatoleum bremense]QTQ33378.1 Putative 3-oxoacyl-[acyl-carrier-protein] synthase II [Aromatoleum bremense]